jgi:hypothetical protein
MAEYEIPTWQEALGQARRAWLALPAAMALAGLGLILGAVQIARADMAPFPAQAGTSFGTNSVTDIRMVSETVLIQVTDLAFTDVNGEAHTVLGANVTADFLLDNPQASPQTLQVGFPLDVPSQATDAGGYAKISALRAYVAGNEATTQISAIGSETWAGWQMSFAPGETSVRVTYDLPATRDNCSAELGYVLHTGAAWASSIGHADLIVRFPYVAETNFVSPHGIYLGDTTPGYQAVSNDLRWHYDHLEPTAANDLAVTFVAPDCWRTVAQARVALNQKASAENYWHVATAMADIVFPHHGFYSPVLAQIADVEYQQALELDSGNPDLNAEYAEYLMTQVGYLLPASRGPDVIRQCYTAQAANPGDDTLASDCNYRIAYLLQATNVPTQVQATMAALLDTQDAESGAGPTETACRSNCATPAEATRTPQPSSTPTVEPTARPTLTAAATAAISPLPVATATAVPPATQPATAIAALPASPVPTSVTSPFEQTESGPDIAALVIVLAVLVVVGLAVYVGRRRRS